jgi:hypothetical protein
MSALMSAVGKMFGRGEDAAPKKDELADKVQTFITDKWGRLKSAFINYHLKVWEAILFYAGETWITLDESTKVYRLDTPEDEWVPTPRINRFSPAVDGISSNFVVPEVEAIPSHGKLGDPAAQTVANIATILAKYATKDCALKADYKSDEDKAGLAEKCFILAGCVFTEVTKTRVQIGNQPVMDEAPSVDIQCPTCDKFYPNLPVGTSSCPSCGSPEVQSKPSVKRTPKPDPETGEPMVEPIYRYDIGCKIGNPLYALSRPGAKSMASTPYFFWAERMSLDEINAEFGSLLSFEPKADSIFLDGYSTNYQNALNYYYAGYASHALQVEDSCMVIRLFAAPGKMKEFPEGVYAIYINERLAYYEPWECPEHPFTKLDYLQIPTLFFGRSISFDLVPIQRELQSYESLIKLHGMTSAVEPPVIDENTIVSQITGRADKIIKWRSLGPGSKEPHRMRHGSLDDGIYRQRQALKDEFENISGAVAVWRGQQEGSVTAASAIQQLRSQAELIFSKPTANWNNGWKETVRKLVKFYQKYWNIQQFVSVVGQDRLSEIEMFKKADLDKTVEFMATMHGTPRTREERKSEMLDLYDRGALDVMDNNVKQRAYELFGETGMFNSFNADATRARMENQVIKTGGQPAFMPGIEDMEVHYQIHSDQIKALDFDRWPEESRKLLILHTLETRAKLDELAAAAAASAGEKGPRARVSAGKEKPPSEGGKDDKRFAVPGMKAAPSAPSA